MSAIVVIKLWDREWADCNKCGEWRRLDHAIGYCCGFTRDEIGTPSTEYRDCEVGGMLVCKACHDAFYEVPQVVGDKSVDTGDGMANDQPPQSSAPAFTERAPRISPSSTVIGGQPKTATPRA